MMQWETDTAFMTDAELLAEYRASTEQAGDRRMDLLAAEIERRNLDL